ncbi:MAG: hypothetical protein KGI73_01715 [Patescibacteria group bacterium]|nr:hypothetical protein [Patescibacteria group bacterium]
MAFEGVKHRASQAVRGAKLIGGVILALGAYEGSVHNGGPAEKTVVAVADTAADVTGFAATEAMKGVRVSADFVDARVHPQHASVAEVDNTRSGKKTVRKSHKRTHHGTYSRRDQRELTELIGRSKR